MTLPLLWDVIIPKLLHEAVDDNIHSEQRVLKKAAFTKSDCMKTHDRSILMAYEWLYPYAVPFV